MSLSLSPYCSFLDLSDEDSGYDSPTSSSEDEPLDTFVLPLPPRNTTPLRRDRRNIYHNDSSIGLNRGSVYRKFSENASLALSDIPWPLANFDTWLNPVPVGLTTTTRSSKTQSPLSTTSLSTCASPIVTIEAQRQPSESPKDLHTKPDYLALDPALENGIGLKKKKSLSSRVLRRNKFEALSKLESLRGSVPDSLPPLPASEKATPTSQTLLITHTAPFIARTEIATSSPSEHKAESVIGGAFSVELLSPLSFSKQPSLEIQSESKKIVPSVSIIASSVSLLNEEGKKSSNHQSVKRHHSMQNHQKIKSDSISRKNSVLAEHRRRTRTSSAEIGPDKENQRDQFIFPIKSFSTKTISISKKMAISKIFD